MKAGEVKIFLFSKIYSKNGNVYENIPFKTKSAIVLKNEFLPLQRAFKTAIFSSILVNLKLANEMCRISKIVKIQKCSQEIEKKRKKKKLEKIVSRLDRRRLFFDTSIIFYEISKKLKYLWYSDKLFFNGSGTIF